MTLTSNRRSNYSESDVLRMILYCLAGILVIVDQADARTLNINTHDTSSSGKIGSLKKDVSKDASYAILPDVTGYNTTIHNNGTETTALSTKEEITELDFFKTFGIRLVIILGVIVMIFAVGRGVLYLRSGCRTKVYVDD